MKFLKINESVDLYRSGSPVKTGAVLDDWRAENFSGRHEVDYFRVEQENGWTHLTCILGREDRIFGLGECIGSLDRRGQKFCLFNTDDPVHTPDKESLYGSHCLFMVDGSSPFGVFLDYPGKIFFDAGFWDRSLLRISLASCDFDLYLFHLDSMKEIVRSYLDLTGSPYVPPCWAFGYQQSRWSYPDRTAVDGIISRLKELDIPCDAIYLDIDYMDRYKVFTVHPGRFPDFRDYISHVRNLGIRLIPIIDPGVKVEAGYPVYEEGREYGYFCKGDDSRDYTAACWPGMIHFPDFLDPEVRTWWGECHKELIASGIEGVWNDMNEPAIFYDFSGLKKFYEEVGEIGKLEDPGFEIFRLKGLAEGLANSPESYRSFFHKTDSGALLDNEAVHNLYGFNMALATREGFNRYLPGKRYFLLSRSSYSGQHRISAVWAGDNMSWWEHLVLHIRMLLSLGMCGFFYTGSDVGGFGCNTTGELLVRWTQLGVFTPLFRNHAACGTRVQEPWAFDQETLAITREMIRFRYSLFPYIYTEFMDSVRNHVPLASHLMFFYRGDRVKEIEDQFMFGRSIMAAPVIERNAGGRYVHLPEHRWLCWKVSSWNHLDCEVYGPGDYYIRAPLEMVPVFIRENSLVIQCIPQNHIGESDILELVVTGLVTDAAQYIYYTDSGVDFQYAEGVFSTLEIRVDRIGSGYECRAVRHENPSVPLTVRTVRFNVFNEEGKVFQKELSV